MKNISQNIASLTILVLDVIIILLYLLYYYIIDLLYYTEQTSVNIFTYRKALFPGKQQKQT